MSRKIINVFNNINPRKGKDFQSIQPFHGYITKPLSRAGFLISKGKLAAGWPANEMEGGKNFPNYTGGQFVRQGDEEAFYSDVESATPPEDGLIISGGRTANGRIVVNYTDQELISLAGIQGGWPKLSVASGSTFYATWDYHAVHKTRGYRWYITKQNWDSTKRLTRTAFELEPVYSDFNPNAPFWSYSDQVMAPWKDLSVVLPARTGHQVLLCVWIIADTGMGFYQAFDLDFDGVGEGGGGGSGGEGEGGGEGGSGGEGGGEGGGHHHAEVWSPNSVRYNAGDYVVHRDNLYVCTQTHTSNSGWAQVSLVRFGCLLAD